MKTIARKIIVLVPLLLFVMVAQGCGILILHYVRLNPDGTMDVTLRFHLSKALLANMKPNAVKKPGSRPLTNAEKKKRDEILERMKKDKCVALEGFDLVKTLKSRVDNLKTQKRQDDNDCMSIVRFRTRKPTAKTRAEAGGLVPYYYPAGRRIVFFIRKGDKLRQSVKTTTTGNMNTGPGRSSMAAMTAALSNMMQYQIYIGGAEIEEVFVRGTGKDGGKITNLESIWTGDVSMLDLKFLRTMKKYGKGDVRIIVKLK